MNASYFSCNPNVLVDFRLTFDVYINSSSTKQAKFICVYKRGSLLNREFIDRAVEKYHQLYINEKDRGGYLKLLSKNGHLSQTEKVLTLKSVAQTSLKKLIGNDWSVIPKQELLEEVQHCQEVVDEFKELVATSSLQQVRQMISSLSVHDFYTYDHSVNVCLYALKFYQDFFPQASKQEIQTMGMGALLHDLGKMNVGTHIINKPGQLSTDEMLEMRKHPERGQHLFMSLARSLPTELDWQRVINVIGQHHEHVDGTGYPLGLESSEIDLMAKVCLIADIFDALTTKRSYSDAMEISKAHEIMGRMVGSKIDPQLFKAFTHGLKGLLPDRPVNKITHQDLHPQFDPSGPFAQFELVKGQALRYRYEPDSEEQMAKQKEQYGKVIHVMSGNHKVS